MYYSFPMLSVTLRSSLFEIRSQLICVIWGFINNDWVAKESSVSSKSVGLCQSKVIDKIIRQLKDPMRSKCRLDVAFSTGCHLALIDDPGYLEIRCKAESAILWNPLRNQPSPRHLLASGVIRWSMVNSCKPIGDHLRERFISLAGDFQSDHLEPSFLSNCLIGLDVHTDQNKRSFEPSIQYTVFLILGLERTGKLWELVRS